MRRNKTDRADVDALLEAARCGDIRQVAVKTIDQHTLQAVHSVRTQWQTARVARINALRGLLREHGHTIPVDARTVLRRMTAILDDAAADLPDMLRHTLALVVEEVHELEATIGGLDRQLAQIAATHPVARRLHTIPGVGVLTATALVGAVNHIHAFPRGREFASWLGLTPRGSSSGGRRYLGRISKRGDVHLRCLLAHGARAVLRSALRAAQRAPDRLTGLQQGAIATASHRGRNKATIALANKLARIVWGVWRHDDTFPARPPLTAAT